jgi:hypothetical protein
MPSLIPSHHDPDASQVCHRILCRPTSTRADSLRPQKGEAHWARKQANWAPWLHASDGLNWISESLGCWARILTGFTRWRKYVRLEVVSRTSSARRIWWVPQSVSRLESSTFWRTGPPALPGPWLVERSNNPTFWKVSTKIQRGKSTRQSSMQKGQDHPQFLVLPMKDAASQAGLSCAPQSHNSVRRRGERIRRNPEASAGGSA